MADDLRIVEVPDGLRISFSRTQSRRERIVTCVAAALMFAFVGRLLTSSPIWLIGPFIGAAVGLVISRQRLKSELHANNLEFETVVDGKHISLPRANIQSIYFDREHSDDSDDSFPEGLYADTGSRESCLLGYIEEKRCFEVIAAIYKRFPDMPLKKVKSPYEKHFTSVDLGG